MLHYYGDTVRRLFLLGGFIMAITLPLFFPLTPAPVYVSILSIVGLSIAAGFTAPKKLWVAIIDTLVAITAVVVFEYHAIQAYETLTLWSAFFWINQVLALIFIAALYYSAKTLRGQVTKERLPLERYE